MIPLRHTGIDSPSCAKTQVKKQQGGDITGRVWLFATSAVFIDRTSGDAERIFTLPFLVPHQALTSDRNYINSKHVFK